MEVLYLFTFVYLGFSAIESAPIKSCKDGNEKSVWFTIGGEKRYLTRDSKGPTLSKSLQQKWCRLNTKKESNGGEGWMLTRPTEYDGYRWILANKNHTLDMVPIDTSTLENERDSSVCNNRIFLYVDVKKPGQQHALRFIKTCDGKFLQVSETDGTAVFQFVESAKYATLAKIE